MPQAARLQGLKCRYREATAHSLLYQRLHTTEYFVKLAKQFEDMGADNICIKDMANLLLPFTAYDLVKELKAELRPETKVHLHTHNTTGTGDIFQPRRQHNDDIPKGSAPAKASVLGFFSDISLNCFVPKPKCICIRTTLRVRAI